MVSVREREREKKTRPDTRPSVADGWAGAEMRVFPLFDSMVTDGRTDGRTDKASYRVACPQLKKIIHTSLISANIGHYLALFFRRLVSSRMSFPPRGTKSHSLCADVSVACFLVARVCVCMNVCGLPSAHLCTSPFILTPFLFNLHDCLLLYINKSLSMIYCLSL